jgi:hypothetical protein
VYSDLATKPRPSPLCASRYTVASSSDATLAGMGTLSEGFERFVAAPARLERVWGAFVVWGAAICGSTDETQDAAPCAVACWRGRTTKNLVPFPTLLVTSIRP